MAQNITDGSVVFKHSPIGKGETKGATGWTTFGYVSEQIKIALGQPRVPKKRKYTKYEGILTPDLSSFPKDSCIFYTPFPPNSDLFPHES